MRHRNDLVQYPSEPYWVISTFDSGDKTTLVGFRSSKKKINFYKLAQNNAFRICLIKQLAISKKVEELHSITSQHHITLQLLNPCLIMFSLPPGRSSSRWLSWRSNPPPADALWQTCCWDARGWYHRSEGGTVWHASLERSPLCRTHSTSPHPITWTGHWSVVWVETFRFIIKKKAYWEILDRFLWVLLLNFLTTLICLNIPIFLKSKHNTFTYNRSVSVLAVSTRTFT